MALSELVIVLLTCKAIHLLVEWVENKIKGLFKRIIPGMNKKEAIPIDGRKVLEQKQYERQIVLIGSHCAKRKILKKFCQFYQKLTAFPEFFQFYELTPKFCLTDTPSIRFRNEQKEQEIIKQFTEYCKEKKDQINNIYIVSKFKSFDQLTIQISNAVIYLKSVKHLLGIIITGFEKSLNPDQDRQIILQLLANQFIDQQNVIFLTKEINVQDLKQILLLSSNFQQRPLKF